MGAWKNEDDIKAELRVLTDELKQLREELRDMVSRPKPNPTRAFLHRRSWAQDPRSHAGDTAPDKPPPTKRKRR